MFLCVFKLNSIMLYYLCFNQLEDSGHSYRKVVSRFWKTEGLGGLYKGLTARLSASIPISGIMVISYEWVKRISLKDRESVYN